MRPLPLIASVLLSLAPTANAQTVDFARDVYPIFERHNCRACHNASGVASGTRMHLPAETSQAAVEGFGYSLVELVNHNKPLESILLAKPTNRVQHTGGELISPGGEEEATWISWIRHLATSPDAAARARAATAAQAGRPEPLRRLTHLQYNNTVRDLLGDKTKPANRFPGEDYVNGYINQAEAQSITPLLAEAYSSAAERLARGAFRFGDKQNLIPCEPTGPADRACAERFTREFGQKAFRRPLSQAETQAFVELLLGEGRREEDFLAGAQLVVEAMLQAPDFLFLIERDGDATAGYETASRLSYLLWNSMPDAELFRAAAAGELADSQGVERQARRMLDSPRARAAMDEFVFQWLRFDRALGTVKDAVKYKEFTPQVAEAMTEETRRLFGQLVWNDKDFREFFTARYTFANSFLTALYDLPEPLEPFALVNFPENYDRAGALGQGTFLAQTGKPDETSPTERGLFVREHFLCQEVPPPPPGVNASLPPLALGGKPLTTREVLVQMHTKDPSCASCHHLVDPIGFGFEKFDTTGRRRETLTVALDPTPQQRKQGMKPEEHELPIDSSGSVAGLPNSEFSSPREVGEILAESPVCQKCIVKQLFRYSFGRHESLADAPTIDRAFAAFRDSGFRFRALIMSLATSPAFLREPVRATGD